MRLGRGVWLYVCAQSGVVRSEVRRKQGEEVSLLYYQNVRTLLSPFICFAKQKENDDNCLVYRAEDMFLRAKEHANT